MASLLLAADCTVTMCHSKTKDLAQICRNADILVAAIGKAKFVTKEFVGKDAIVIDVGMNRDENGKLCGDVDFDSVGACGLRDYPGSRRRWSDDTARF